MRETPGAALMANANGGILLVAVLITGASATIFAGDQPEVGAGAVTGRVADARGTPIAGAEVWAVAAREKVGSTRTDADGRFRIADLKEDKDVAIWADAAGFARERRDGLHVFAGRDRDIGTLTLLPGTRLAGRVVDARGRPVAGASVDLKDYRHVLGHTISSEQTEWTFSADAEGRFATGPLPAGLPQIRVAAPGKVRTFLSKKAEPGVAEADLGAIVLADEVLVRGVVVDGDGRPAAGVEVVADYDHENPARTGDDGRFVLHGLGPDAKQVRVQSNDYFAPQPFDIGPDRDDLRLVVIKAYDIRGKAIDAETGEPVPIDTVRLCIVDREPDGSYTLRG